MKTKTLRNFISKKLQSKTKTIRIGKSYNTSGMGTNTPILILENSNQEPMLEGFPYLKTNFSNGKGFSRTLYTPSTLKVTVGDKWISENFSEKYVDTAVHSDMMIS